MERITNRPNLDLFQYYWTFWRIFLTSRDYSYLSDQSAMSSYKNKQTFEVGLQMSASFCTVLFSVIIHLQDIFN